jgi:hypothetical protein
MARRPENSAVRIFGGRSERPSALDLRTAVAQVPRAGESASTGTTGLIFIGHAEISNRIDAATLIASRA